MSYKLDILRELDGIKKLVPKEARLIKTNIDKLEKIHPSLVLSYVNGVSLSKNTCYLNFRDLIGETNNVLEILICKKRYFFSKKIADKIAFKAGNIFRFFTAMIIQITTSLIRTATSTLYAAFGTRESSEKAVNKFNTLNCQPVFCGSNNNSRIYAVNNR